MPNPGSSDADGSGALSLDEFRTAVARAADWGFAPADASDDGLSKQEVAQAFRALDTDGSGSVSYSEFVAVLREQARPSGPLGGAARAERASALSFTFRTLTKDEAESRARLHFKTASGLHSRLLRMPADDPKRERISLQALQLGEKGSRLLSLARRLEGAADPPERPPPRRPLASPLSPARFQAARGPLAPAPYRAPACRENGDTPQSPKPRLGAPVRAARGPCPRPLRALPARRRAERRANYRDGSWQAMLTLLA